MAELKGTNVAAPVVPFADTDIYATHDEAYGCGGYRSVTSVKERDAIPEQRRKAGMLVKVLEEDIVYELEADLKSWKIFSAGASSGSGIGEVTAEAVALAPEAAPAVQVEKTEDGQLVNLHFVFGIPVQYEDPGHVEFSESEVTLPAEGGSAELQIISNLEWRIS